MKNFSDIKHRIKSISDTRKITGAMEMISVAKMQKAMKKHESNKAYFTALRKVINDIVTHSKNVDHKAFCNSGEKNVAFIITASDKGLVGGFNHDVLRYAENAISDCENPHLFVIGRVCAEYFKAKNFAIDDVFADASFDPSVMRAAEISEIVYKMFDSGEIDCAYMIYTAMNGAKTVIDKIKLLPLDDCILGDTCETLSENCFFDEINYEPSAEEVLAELIPQYLTGIIYGALVQSSVCEHGLRRSAMDSATHNADELLEKLKSEYNRARQETVTGELIDIVTASYGAQHDD